MTFLIVFTALSLLAPQRRDAERPWRLHQDIPAWIRSEFKMGYYDRSYEVAKKLYPEYLRGDFNGDGKPDFAVQVRRRSTGTFGIAVFQAKRTQSKPAAVFIAGAGKALGKNTDLDWVEIWSVFSKAEAYREIQSARMPKFWGDVLKLQTKKGKAGFMYWSGDGYSWYPVAAKTK